MNINNHTALAMLVVTELSVELIADVIEKTLGNLPWMHWYMNLHYYRIPEIIFCYAMMGTIIAAMVMLEPKLIEDFMLSVWKKLKALSSKYYSWYRSKRKQKTTV
ncbi:MAG: hypothetical protein KGV56_05390 [Gammaproteobacteria bacterium]|nr:hypothetical protein [Gammaproteobacteria bacterium]